MPLDHAGETVAAGIRQASSLYYRLLLLVGPAGSGKSATLTAVSKQTGAVIVNVGLELSRSLLDLTIRERGRQVRSLLTRLVAEAAREGDAVLLDNTELLFDASLQQDPLRLLQTVARNTTVVAAWTGELHEGKIRYAVPSHPEHRAYSSEDLLVVAAGREGLAL